ncbi:MAG: T9SS type A sorting domain-containing protein [Sphingobacteriaceae bacterium]|nr:T9SS type A sorting domain-containing protein [Sphingobacteriaceae bacterium]
MKLINSLGQVVIEESLNKDCCSKDLNIQGLPKGIYLLQIKGKSLSEVKKVMIY